MRLDVWQYFICMVDIRSVGVIGEQRIYDYTIAIHVVTSFEASICDLTKIL
ncbi:GMP synthase (glutamine-hydrolyzing) [Anaerorhabdus sp.]|uniref:GMP synthase (glutamine-hydrolyzing) n=1 Tax=Anaerorhabdus sp. TaxID=1872524 RepID=UPI003FA52C33